MKIVMTGATAGFGAITAQKLIAAGHSLTIGARDIAAAQTQCRGGADILPLDLDSLASVRAFAGAINGLTIDALVLNAGLQLAAPQTSADGFERTFAVNHLAHYLLLRLATPMLKPGARVILTASGTHDPAEKTPVTPPDHARADWLAYPNRDERLPQNMRSQLFRAYSSSKLCNILTSREFARRHEGFAVMAFDPAYVPGTRLARGNPAALAWLAGKIIPMMIPKGRTSTVPVSGGRLADLVLAKQYGLSRGEYWCVRSGHLERHEPSALARNAEAARALWEDSARLVGL